MYVKDCSLRIVALLFTTDLCWKRAVVLLIGNSVSIHLFFFLACLCGRMEREGKSRKMTSTEVKLSCSIKVLVIIIALNKKNSTSIESLSWFS